MQCHKGRVGNTLMLATHSCASLCRFSFALFFDITATHCSASPLRFKRTPSIVLRPYSITASIGKNNLTSVPSAGTGSSLRSIMAML